MEEWKRIIIDNIETNYSISNYGNVRNDETNKIFSQSNQLGYQFVGIKVKNKTKRMRVHRLVASAFIPNPENKPYVNHIDGNKSNNHVSNLEWVTPSENTKHARDNNLISYSTKPVRQYSLEGDLMMEFESATEAARQLGLLQSKIIECCLKSRRTTGLYQWRYASENIDKLPPVNKPSNIKKKVAQYDKEGNLIAIYESYTAAAKAVNGTESAISRICAGKKGLHTHKGFVWKIVDDIVQEEIDS